MSVSNAQQFCTFYVDRQFFGVPVQQVQEVIRYQEMTRVPLVPRVIRGLINLRGQIVVAIDLRRRLNAPERPEEQLPMNVVVRTADGALSLLVDEIGDGEISRRRIDAAADCFTSCWAYSLDRRRTPMGIFEDLLIVKIRDVYVLRLVDTEGARKGGAAGDLTHFR